MGENKLRKVNESNLNEKREKSGSVTVNDPTKEKALPKPDDAAALVSEDFDPFGRKTTKESSANPGGRSKRRNDLPPLPDSPKVDEIENETEAEFTVERTDESEETQMPDEEYETDKEYEENEEVLEDIPLEDTELYEDFENEDDEDYEEEELYEDEEEKDEDEEEYDEYDEYDEDWDENEDDRHQKRTFPGIRFKKPAAGVIGAPRVKTLDEKPQIKNSNNVPLSHSSAAQKNLKRKAKAEVYDVNFDGYYDDRLPAILDEVTKASYVDIVVKGILAVACVIALIIYCIYYVNV